MIVDLHAHYPMHLLPPGPGGTLGQMRSRQWKAHWRARTVRVISRFANYEGPGGQPGVTVPLMRTGDARVVLSMLYSPLDEIDLSKGYGEPPESEYFHNLIDQLDVVEQEISARHAGQAVVAHSAAGLDAAIAAGQVALIHAVEGGHALGATEAEIKQNVAELRHRGVAYVTLAHLFWRRVATNAPALPFMPDWLYKLVFRQPGSEGLSDLGRAAVRAMHDNKVLIDVTHMSTASLKDTFDLLGQIDPQKQTPVIASHMACRCGRKGPEYNTGDDTIREIKARGGVMGVIACRHWATVNLGKDRTFADSVDRICAHIDRIHDVTGSHEYAAIGSDLDGYIKPALKGIEHMGRMRRLEAELVARYGPADAKLICSDNALRVLRGYWG
ncbi:MAG: rane dipeptidase [Thermoleophilaceae bacterium]|nr:rane dipeptidase [Thermoleophilaceae bacterium]